jgi:hypothetical protein
MSETPEARGMMRGTSSAGDVIVRYLDKYDAMDAADHSRSITINRQIIEAAASGRDSLGRSMGWTVAQVSIIDPMTRRRRLLHSGWRARAEGVVTSWSEAVRFMTAAKTKKNRPKPGSKQEAEAIALLKRLAAGQTTVPRQRAVQAVGNPTAPPAPLETRLSTAQPEDMLALLLGDDTPCPICRGSRVGPGGGVCALCVPPWE